MNMTIVTSGRFGTVGAFPVKRPVAHSTPAAVHTPAVKGMSLFRRLRPPAAPASPSPNPVLYPAGANRDQRAALRDAARASGLKFPIYNDDGNIIGWDSGPHAMPAAVDATRRANGEAV